jgi:predicted  nucleic acid-binding Zn-ribbon protein
MSISLNLYRLQKIDTAINKIEIRLAEINIALNDDQKIKIAEKALEKAQEKTKKVRINLRKLEGKVESKQIKRKTDQAALFSGRIKNPKELQDLQNETEALRQYISQLEDEQLDLMIEHEAAEKAEEKARLALKQARGTNIEENAALIGEKSKLQEDFERLTREKTAVLQAIPPQSLSLYSRLRKAKRGIAVAGIMDGCCKLCGQQLTPGDLQTIRSSTSFVYCPSCGRILYGE